MGGLVREIRLTGPGRRWQVHIPPNRVSRLCLLEPKDEVEEAIYGSPLK